MLTVKICDIFTLTADTANPFYGFEDMHQEIAKFHENPQVPEEFDSILSLVLPCILHPAMEYVGKFLLTIDPVKEILANLMKIDPIMEFDQSLSPKYITWIGMEGRRSYSDQRHVPAAIIYGTIPQ